MNSASFGISCRIVRESPLSSIPSTLTHDPFIRKDLLQVLSVLTMERPVSFAAEDIRDEKVRTPTGRDARRCYRTSYLVPSSTSR